MTPADSVVTFDGVGGIRAIKENGTGETYIEGRFAETDDTLPLPTQGFYTTGKLVKTGAGTLVFRNLGLNDFTEGIELGGGTTAFNLASQLGNRLDDPDTGQYVGNKITFTADSTLRADDSDSTYNETTINTDLTATFKAAEGVEWNFFGEMHGDGSTTLDKTGEGTLSLNNYYGQIGSSDFVGAVEVSAGELAVYGNYGDTRSFEVKEKATLSGTGTIGAVTDGGFIRSGGHLAPGGLSTYNPENLVAPMENPLTIVGNLTFDAGSNFDVRITQFDNGGSKLAPFSDQVKVTGGGTVNIDSKANLNVDIDFWGDTQTINDYNAERSGSGLIFPDQVGHSPDTLF